MVVRLAENENGEEKTEKPTPKRLREARKKGQVMKSQDITAVAFVLLTFFTLRLSAKLAYVTLQDSLEYWINICGGGLTDNIIIDGDVAYKTLIYRITKTVVVSVLPVMLVGVAVTIIATGIQTKFLISAESLKPKFDKLNPFQGIKKMFSGKAFFELAKSLLKFIVIAVVVYTEVRDRMGEVARTLDMEPRASLVYIADTIFRIVMKIGITFIVIAVIDLFYQRYSFENDMKMTKQEVKDEYKSTEGDPKIKGKRRQKQQELHNMMMQNVRGADVVVRNPTHYAVALKYDPNVREAPVVVARGADRVALRIIKTAEENDIVLIENRPLARALYEKTKVDFEIPFEFYREVAEILNFVYELKHIKPPVPKKGNKY